MIARMGNLVVCCSYSNSEAIVKFLAALTAASAVRLLCACPSMDFSQPRPHRPKLTIPLIPMPPPEPVVEITYMLEA